MSVIYDDLLGELSQSMLEPIENQEIHLYHRIHCIEERTSLDFLSWHLKDVLSVPLREGIYDFRVEHISDEKIYFVAVNALCELEMGENGINIRSYLDRLFDEFPKDLRNMMCPIEHKFCGEIISDLKLSLLSRGNVFGDTDCDGADDSQFDGFKTGSDRCKNSGSSTYLWWLDTPVRSASSAYGFYFVCSNGYGSSYSANGTCGVCPCFCIYR